MLACMNITPIPYHVLLNSGAPAESSLFNEFTTTKGVATLDALADLGLVEPHTIDNTDDPRLSHVLSLHPVVHGVLRDDVDVRRKRAEYYGLNLQMLLAATHGANPDAPESWELWNIVAPHTVEVSRTSLLGGPQLRDRSIIVAALELARLTIRYLIIIGILGPADNLAEALVSQCEKFGCDIDDREILALRHEAARIALERGFPVAAEAELRRIIVGRERNLGHQNADTLASRHKLAKAIMDQGRWSEAESLLRSIVLAERTVRGPEHNDTIVVRHSLARAIMNQGRAVEAEALLREILTVRRRFESSPSPETLFVRQSIAQCLMAQGKPVDAEDELRNAMRDTAKRRDAHEAMSLRYHLSVALVMQDHLPEAVTELAELLADQQRVLGEGHPDVDQTRRLLTKTRAGTGVHDVQLSARDE
jgi:hypothetical protein